MSFPINVNIPNTPNDPADDQPEIKKNFANISGYLTVDHIAPGALNNGFHKVIHQPAQNPNVDPAPIAGVGQTYTKTVGSDVQLFYESGLGAVTQLTGPKQPLVTAIGYTSLPGGVLMQWGSTTVVTSTSSTPVTFPTPFPTAVFSVVATVVTDDNSTIRFSILNDATTTGFVTTQTSTSHFTRLYWLAIGN